VNGYLLDTHALIWWFMNSPLLGEAARRQLSETDSTVFVSAVSAYEMALKHRIGRLPEVAALIADYSRHLAGQGFTHLAVSAEHALRAGGFELGHRDPFDRMLIAQAQLEGLTLVSNERLFDRFGISRLWN
jgi:PIN domain nuclease of toxin-antitoxin system